MATRRNVSSKTRTGKMAKSPPAPSKKAAKRASDAVAADSGAARTEYRIYPSIGIARVGDSGESFIGPEAPGVTPQGPFRGKDGGLKPQGARFRIYQIDIDANQNEKVVREVTGAKDVAIEWNVALANRKAAARQIFGDGSGTLTRNAAAKFRNDGFDRAKLVIAAEDSIKSDAGTSVRRLAGAIAFVKANKVQYKVDDIELATLRVDEAGRLIVIGGPGKSGSRKDAKIDTFSDNDGWYDSVSDGPVSATLSIAGMPHAVIPAWVVVTVPRFAPGIYGIITWFDQALNMARTNEDGTFDPPRTTSFLQDIYPILKRADALAAVHFTAHGLNADALSSNARIQTFRSDPAARAVLQTRLTRPNVDSGGFERVPEMPGMPGQHLMPMLNSGANPDPKGSTWAYLSLTPYQFAHVQHWVMGDFVDDWPGAEPAPKNFDAIAVAGQPHALNEAALTACVGGAFFPGIEGTYDIARIGTYHPLRYLRQEFRIDPSLPPGSITEKMALPWQADFADCERFWWPSQRPVAVKTEKGESAQWSRGINDPKPGTRHRNMVSFWSQLGFIVLDPTSGEFREQDRRVINGVA